MQHLSSLPVQMGDDGLSPSQYGAVIALNGALIVLVTVPLTRWLQAYPRSRVLAVSWCSSALGFGATAWASSVPAYAATVAIWTVGEVIGAAVGPSVVADLAPTALRGRYQGVFGFSFATAVAGGAAGSAAPSTSTSAAPCSGWVRRCCPSAPGSATWPPARPAGAGCVSCGTSRLPPPGRSCPPRPCTEL